MKGMITTFAFWLCCLAAGLAVGGTDLAMAEDDLAGKVAALEKRVKELEQQTVLSLPELIVREKKVFVCEKGHSFTQAQSGNSCPHDGTKLSTQKTYQKDKYYRRKTIEEKIEEALADVSPVSVGLSMTGLAFQTLGTGRGAKNDFFGSGSGDVNFTAKPAYNTVLYVDLEFLADTGVKSRVPALTNLVSDDARLQVNGGQENEEVNLREAWISTVIGRNQEWTLVAGSIDLGTIFDLNRYAVDETLQFTADIFVHNLFFGPPTNGAGVAVVYDPKGPYALRFGAQRPTGANSNLGGNRIYSIAELDLRARPWKGWQTGNYRFWIRANGEMHRRSNIAYGVSLDQDITRTLSFFGRYGGGRRTQSTVAATDANGKPIFPNRDDLHYTLGFELRGPDYTFLPRDVWGVAYGRSEVRSIDGEKFGNGGPGENESLVEGYYRFFVTEHLHLTPFVQWLADSIRAETNLADDLILGFRTQVDF